MAHNFLQSSPAQAGMSLPSDPKALVDRFLDAIWMERGLSENTLGAYRADLLALNQRPQARNVDPATPRPPAPAAPRPPARPARTSSTTARGASKPARSRARRRDSSRASVASI